MDLWYNFLKLHLKPKQRLYVHKACFFTFPSWLNAKSKLVLLPGKKDFSAFSNGVCVFLLLFGQSDSFLYSLLYGL